MRILFHTNPHYFSLEEKNKKLKQVARENLYKGMDPLNNAAQTYFGIPYLFPYQRLVISNIIEAAQQAGLPIQWAGKNEEDCAASFQNDETDENYAQRQIVILPTGAGKSLCFQLPSVMLPGATLVIYPILSLMNDQARRLTEKNLAPVLLRGGQSEEERNLIWEKVKKGESRFIIANPEILLTPRVLEKLPELGIVHLVIDEAHCVSEWGESFRPAYLKIGEIINAIKKVGSPMPFVTAFTATASAPVLEKIEKIIFNDENANRVTGNPDRSNISYSAQACLLKDKAVRDLIEESPRPSLVFCSTRIGAENIARYLIYELKDKEIKFYHAGLSREEKSAVEQWYLKNPRGVLAATCAFGMGVDKADIRTVVHRDCPPSIEAYLQESGRAGRDGLPSRAILLWSPQDVASIRANTEADKQRVFSLLKYAENTGRCRREALLNLLNYKGEMPVPETDCCDVCNKTAKKALREAWIVDFFRKRPRSYTAAESAKLLSQHKNFGWTESDIKKAVYVLIEQGILTKGKRFWKDKITALKNSGNLISRHDS